VEKILKRLADEIADLDGCSLADTERRYDGHMLSERRSMIYCLFWTWGSYKLADPHRWPQDKLRARRGPAALVRRIHQFQAALGKEAQEASAVGAFSGCKQRSDRRECLMECLQNRTVIVACGVGRDSTGMLVGLHERGIRPAAILFADVGSEKRCTYDFIPHLQAWLASVKFPPLTIVRYQPVRAPYSTLEGNMLANATLPGATFNRGSCTLKFKVQPQDRFCRRFAPCLKTWERGDKVIKLIGFEACEGYRRQRAADRVHAGRGTAEGNRYEWQYPLMEWGWDLERCKQAIADAGMPIPPKSACFFTTIRLIVGFLVQYRENRAFLAGKTTQRQVAEYENPTIKRIVVSFARISAPTKSRTCPTKNAAGSSAWNCVPSPTTARSTDFGDGRDGRWACRARSRSISWQRNFPSRH
jgi:hypothetical protein